MAREDFGLVMHVPYFCAILYSVSMKNYFKLITIFPILLGIYTFTGPSYSKVDPPNYDFSLKELQKFYPGADATALLKTKPQVITKSGATTTYKVYVSQIRYKFPVFFQVKDNKVLDFYARLPNYFLHDIFHQSLINRYGKQDKYKNKNEHSIYLWNNKNKARHLYEAACAITCYPIYYSASLPKENWPVGFKPLSDKFLKTETELKKKPSEQQE
jgi:hypothetical protein